MKRIDGRAANEIRPLLLEPNFVIYPEGSILISLGNTRVLCNASIQKGVPSWMSGKGNSRGWITAEYALLPRSTHTRTSRETNGLRGRTQEIKRLIARSLRKAVDLEKLGELTCIVDCDVLQADGGTRTAAITGGYTALALALHRKIQRDELPADVLLPPLAAISVGMVDGSPILDLNYEEDFKADVDLNVVMNARGEYIEVQGTAEGDPFSRQALHELLDLSETGIRELLARQQVIIANELGD
jgi:ribonuclease PH